MSKASANPSGSIIFQIHCFLSKRMYLVYKARIFPSLLYLLVLSWILILAVKYKSFLKNKRGSGRGRMASNCIASSLFGETKTFLFSFIIHDILNLYQPLFDSFMSKLFHLRIVKHCNFVNYYQVTRMKISTVLKFYYRGCNWMGI